MNLDALDSFRVFASTLNFTHAAQQRHLTQPALHKQVQNLAQELGVVLYGKKGKALYLTQAGVEVARFARETHERLADLRGKVRGSDIDLPITISAGRGSYLYLLGPAIRDFQESNPGILKIQVNNTAETIGAVRSGTAHIGATVLMEEPNDLKVTPLLDVTPHVVVSREHPLCGRNSLSVGDLDGLPLITPPPPSALRDMIRTSLKRKGKAFNPVMDAPGWELAMHLASLGLGATIVNGCCRPPPQTRAIPLNDLPDTTYYLVERESGAFRNQVIELRDCILKQASSVNLFRESVNTERI